MAFGAQVQVGLGIASKPDDLKLRLSATCPALYRGDLVKLVSDGTVTGITNATDTPCGIFEGYHPDSPSASTFLTPYRNYYPGSIAADAYISGTNPFSILTIESSGTVAATAVFAQVDPATTAGNSLTGISGMVATTSSPGTGAATFQIIGKADIPNNEWGNTTTILKVIWKRHAFNTSTGV